MRFSLLQTGVEAGAFQTVNLGCGIWLDLKVCQLENITTWNLKTWNLKSWNLNLKLKKLKLKLRSESAAWWRLEPQVGAASWCHGPDGSGREGAAAGCRCAAGRLARGDRWKRMRGRFKVVEQDPGNLDFQWHTQCCQSCAFASDLLVRAYWEQTTWNLIGWTPSHPTNGADEDRCRLFVVGRRFCLFLLSLLWPAVRSKRVGIRGAHFRQGVSAPSNLELVRKGFLLQLDWLVWMLSHGLNAFTILSKALEERSPRDLGVIHDPRPYLRVRVISAGHFTPTNFLRIWYFGFQVSPWWW